MRFIGKFRAEKRETKTKTDSGGAEVSDTKAKRAVTYIAGAAAIAVAYLCRLPIGEQILSGKAGYLRSFIYIAF